MDALYPEDLVMNGYHGFLFRNRSGYFLSAHNINRAIERISIAYNAEEMDQAELEDREPNLLPHFSVHNLRHTFCTRLCEKTNDIKFIQQVMGHADFSTTMDIYTHITQESMKEKAEVIKDDLVLMWKLQKRANPHFKRGFALYFGPSGVVWFQAKVVKKL